MIWLPSEFTYFDWQDPEPKGTESKKLRPIILEYLEKRAVHYGLVFESDRVGIYFRKPSDAVHFKLKMSEWEETYRKYKGIQFDVAMVYAPYIPLISRTAIPNSNIRVIKGDE